VTTGGKTYTLPEPFFVLATQNPIEHEGTYHLPEAQLDRFMFMIEVGYPTPEEELEVMRRGTGSGGGKPRAIMTGEHIHYMQNIVRKMPVADHILSYAQKLAGATRKGTAQALDFCEKWLAWGAGPRASLNLILAAKAHALLRGQVYVGCEDVAAVAPSVMRHRIIPNFAAQSEGLSAGDIVQKILAAVPQTQK
jgi:MoxR-like ATPase